MKRVLSATSSLWGWRLQRRVGPQPPSIP